MVEIFSLPNPKSKDEMRQTLPNSFVCRKIFTEFPFRLGTEKNSGVDRPLVLRAHVFILYNLWNVTSSIWNGIRNRLLNSFPKRNCGWKEMRISKSQKPVLVFLNVEIPFNIKLTWYSVVCPPFLPTDCNYNWNGKTKETVITHRSIFYGGCDKIINSTILRVTSHALFRIWSNNNSPRNG